MVSPGSPNPLGTRPGLTDSPLALTLAFCFGLVTSAKNSPQACLSQPTGTLVRGQGQLTSPCLLGPKNHARPPPLWLHTEWLLVWFWGSAFPGYCRIRPALTQHPWARAGEPSQVGQGGAKPVTVGELCALGVTTLCSEEGRQAGFTEGNQPWDTLIAPQQPLSVPMRSLALQPLSWVQERPPWLPRFEYTSTSISSRPPSQPHPHPRPHACSHTPPDHSASLQPLAPVSHCCAPVLPAASRCLSGATATFIPVL